MEFMFIWLILVLMISAAVCDVIAIGKNRLGSRWFCMGLLLGPLGVLIVALLPKVE